MTTNCLVSAVGQVRCQIIRDVPRGVFAAYEAGGVKSLSPLGVLHALDAVLGDEASMADTREQLCGELLDGGVDVVEWIESAGAKLDRARRFEDIRGLISADLGTYMHHHVSDLRATAGADLAEPIAATIKEIAGAAAHLPSVDPLDHARCVAQGSAEHLRTVDDGLRRLGSMLGVLPQLAVGRDVAPVAELLPLLDIPQCEPAKVHSIAQGAEVLNPDPNRDGICSLVEHARRSQDEALVRALRGDYPGVAFGLAWSRAERNQRAQRVRTAMTRERVAPTRNR